MPRLGLTSSHISLVNVPPWRLGPALLDFSLEIEVVSAVAGICGRELHRLEEIPFRFIEAVIAFLSQPQVEIGVPRARIRPDRTAHDQCCAVVFLLVEVKHSESKQRSE